MEPCFHEQELTQSEMGCLLAQWEELGQPEVFHQGSPHSGGILSAGAGKTVEILKD